MDLRDGARGAGRGARIGFVRAFGMAVMLASFATRDPRPATLGAQDLGIEVGKPAPAAAVETLDGKAVDLAQWIGKGPVVMEFWATWCPNCKELEPALKALHAKYGAKARFVTVAVSINQTPERAKLYVQKYKLPGEVVFDRRGNASGAYDVPATSYVVVVDRAGRVIYTGLGGKQPALEAAIRKTM